MNRGEIRIGTRGSPLALAQARLVAQALEREERATRLVIVQTQGDRIAPDTAWGEGAFVAAIERALLSGRVDVAVHSAKDIPTAEDARLRIAAYLPRADPRDGLVLRDGQQGRLDDLRPGSRVGTDSPRRTGFVLAHRPDLLLHPIHGNVDTRLRRLDKGETDALVLACAGLDRIGLGGRISEHLDPDTVPPAPGQGAIAVQIRRDDGRMLALAAAIDHLPTRRAVEAERAFLAAAGGGCRAPIGALATLHDDELDLLGGFVDADGTGMKLAHRRGPAAAGSDVARELVGVLSPLLVSRAEEGPVAAEAPLPRVLVTRAAEQAAEIMSALRDAGVDPVLVPTIAVELESPGGDLEGAVRQLQSYAWVVVTSANGARALLDAAERSLASVELPRVAAVGPATRRVFEDRGLAVDLEPRGRSASSLAVDLPITPGDRVLLVRGDLAHEELPTALRARGALIDDVVAYTTKEAPATSRSALRQAFAEGPIDAVIFTSGSTVRGLAALARSETLDVLALPAVCIGPETATEARRVGFRVLAVSPVPHATALAATAARALPGNHQAMP
jgi:hydroxymethylbilane synthase